NEVAIGVELAKEAVGEGCLPSVELDPFPARDNLRSFDGHLFTFGGLVHNALLVRLTTAGRVDALPINASVHSNHIARLRPKRSSRNSLEHPTPGTLVGIASLWGNMVLRPAWRSRRGYLGGGRRGATRSHYEGREHDTDFHA